MDLGPGSGSGPGSDASTLVFWPAGPFTTKGYTLTGGPLLVLVGVAATAGGVWWAPVVALLGLWYALMARQWARLTDRDLTVQGRLTRRRVDLARLREVHEDRSRSAWLVADGQRPFRVCFARPTQSESDPEQGLVLTLRRRARACGAAIDVGAELVARPPKGTSPFFSL